MTRHRKPARHSTHNPHPPLVLELFLIQVPNIRLHLHVPSNALPCMVESTLGQMERSGRRLFVLSASQSHLPPLLLQSMGVPEISDAAGLLARILVHHVCRLDYHNLVVVPMPHQSLDD
jgi:hypothetical protein